MPPKRRASLPALKDLSMGRETPMTAGELIGILQQLPQHARLSVYLSERGLPRMRETLHLLESPKNATRLRNAIAEFRDTKMIEAMKKLPPVVSNLADVTLDLEVQAVVFDAKTLCRITDLRKPFFGLLNRGCQARDFWPELKVIMTQTLDLSAAANILGINLAPEDLATLEIDLAAELASIELFPETIDVLTRLRDRGIKLAIVSNLAAPYASPFLALLPFTLDAYAWSFKIGSLKPDRRVFAWTCEQLGVLPENTLMIGARRSDYDGATRAGLRAMYLVRDDAPAE